MMNDTKSASKIIAFHQLKSPDESMRTFWAAKTGNPGEWLEMDLGAVMTVRALQVNYYDYKTIQHNRANDVYYQYRIYASCDGKNWELVVDKSDNDTDCPHSAVQHRKTR